MRDDRDFGPSHFDYAPSPAYQRAEAASRRGRLLRHAGWATALTVAALFAVATVILNGWL